MDFAVPQDIQDYLEELDRFIDAEIKPLEQQDDNIRFFDHRREHARTDWDNQGLPRKVWEELLAEARRRADAAGHLRYAWPVEWGGKGGSNLAMAIIREHLAAKGLGLHNDLQTEHSIVGNNPFIIMFKEFATNAQYDRYSDMLQKGQIRTGFGLTEPNHGSDATFMETRAVREEKDGASGWRINGEKMWTTGMHVANYIMTFARTSGKDGDSSGITVFLVPASDPGVKIEEYLWTFNMPTDHPRVSLTNVWVSDDAIWGVEGQGLRLGQSFVHQNRIRQAASSLGAGVFCIEESVRYARTRKPFGKPLSDNQAIQWPLVELATQAEMLRLLIRKTAWEMDNMPHKEVERQISDKVSMCNYWANRLCCEAADRAMQVHGGIGYSRHKPFEHIYRHHRRYRITEGSEEIQMRKVAAFLFGYMGPRKVEFAGTLIMLSKADDFPIHQTAEPIAYAGTDRNFYDRYFFNGYNPDGSGFFAVAFGVYPHLNVADAHVSVIRDGVEYCVHASRILHMERFDLEVGPIKIEVLEPLKRLKVTLAATDGLAAEFVFEGRAFPIEEPRFIRRNGPRAFMDYTRLTQNGRYTGWVEIDGKREALAAGCVGTRDRSWGIRPIGAPDAQPVAGSTSAPGFFWQWTPMNFADRSIFFHFTADSSGVPWNTRAVVAPDGAGAADMIEIEHADMQVTIEPGTRHARAATLHVPMPNSPGLEIDFKPFQTFLMRGIGYTHPKWGHGRLHGELEVEREDLPLTGLNVNAMENLHIQALSTLTLREKGRPDQTGLGVFEQLAFGPYPPLGLS